MSAPYVPSWPAYRQRQALSMIADFQRIEQTPEGEPFMQQLRDVVGKSLVSHARKFSYYYDRDAALSLLWDNVHTVNSSGRREFATAAAVADNPWGYLVTSAEQWFYDQEMGHRFIELDAQTDAAMRGCRSPRNVAFAGYGILHAATRTAEVLARRTPLHLVDDVTGLVHWLAQNPPQRQSYEHVDLKDAHSTFDILSKDQVAAVSNVTWGARPTPAETSLLAGFLCNEDFNPSTSEQRERLLPALRRYKQKMFEAAS